MPLRRWRFRLRHILEAASRILVYTDGLDEASFSEDEKTIDAVIRNFLVIGEAVRNVPEEFRAKHPEIRWSSMHGMRNILVHDYEQISADVVWNTIQRDLPDLIRDLKPLVEDSS